ncbi:MAG: PEP-CTERM sorting domain-containing protein [Chlorobium sp.]|nr:PEP-CTERM sorting domain-containing protein [Chlorobium sp.]
MYSVNPASSRGTWSTTHVTTTSDNYPTLSHLSGSIVSTPVPEPGVTMLFSIGFAGFIGMIRRRRQ